MAPEDRQQFVNKVWTPLETIAKHLAVERSKQAEEEGLAATRYQESSLDNKNEETKFQGMNDPSEPNVDNSKEAKEITTIPSNHKSSAEKDYASTEKYEFEAQKIVRTTTEDEREHDDSNTTVIPNETTVNGTTSTDLSKDIDTVEGFKRFSDSVSKVD